MGSGITCAMNCNYRTAATLHTPELWFVSGIKSQIPWLHVMRHNNNNNNNNNSNSNSNNNNNNNNNTKWVFKWLAAGIMAADLFPARALKYRLRYHRGAFKVSYSWDTWGEAARSVKLRIHLSFLLSIMSESSQPRFVRFNDINFAQEELFDTVWCRNDDRSVICDECSGNELRTIPKCVPNSVWSSSMIWRSSVSLLLWVLVCARVGVLPSKNHCTTW